MPADTDRQLDDLIVRTALGYTVTFSSRQIATKLRMRAFEINRVLNRLHRHGHLRRRTLRNGDYEWTWIND